jgi:hypothetical protein
VGQTIYNKEDDGLEMTEELKSKTNQDKIRQDKTGQETRLDKTR